MSATQQGGTTHKLSSDAPTPGILAREQSPPCYLCCIGVLQVTIGEFGQSIEKCSNANCVLAQPHRPTPSPDQPMLPKHEPRQRPAKHGSGPRSAIVCPACGSEKVLTTVKSPRRKAQQIGTRKPKALTAVCECGHTWRTVSKAINSEYRRLEVAP